ncbi:hypothetical protein FACS1894113_5630 [Alphaproteobacteria bacterium]|nr:hypothetical protein FACS1894113_5630 [Alphaproteobacteria bacterium]
MASVVFCYIFRRLLVSLLVVSPIVIMMVWIALSVRYISLLITEDIGIVSFLKMIFCIIPDISGIILPICFLIAAMSVFYKMQGDKELIVLMTGGQSKLSLCLPLFGFSILVAGFMLSLQAVLAPYSYKQLNNLHEQIRNQVSMSIVKPGVFNVIGSSVIYVSKKTDTSLEDVFISYVTKNKKAYSNIITAKKGSYALENNTLIISLESGYRQELDKNNEPISVLKFDNFSYDVTEFVHNFSQKIKKIHEKTQGELLRDAKNAKDIETKNKYISEYHRRLTMPFLAIVNAIIVSLFMMKPDYRAKRWKGSILAFLTGVCAQILLMTAINASAKHTGLIQANYAALIITSATMLMRSLRRE